MTETREEEGERGNDGGHTQRKQDREWQERGEHRMNITYLLHQPIRLELVAIRQAVYGRTLRVTRGMIQRGATLSIMRASPVVAIQPEARSTTSQVNDGARRRWSL
jgi:hypothetical protein